MLSHSCCYLVAVDYCNAPLEYARATFQIIIAAPDVDVHSCSTFNWLLREQKFTYRSMSLSAQPSFESIALAILMRQRSNCASLHIFQTSWTLRHLAAMPTSRHCARWRTSTRTGHTATFGLWVELIPSWSATWTLVASVTQLCLHYLRNATCMLSCSMLLDVFALPACIPLILYAWRVSC